MRRIAKKPSVRRGTHKRVYPRLARSLHMTTEEYVRSTEEYVRSYVRLNRQYVIFKPCSYIIQGKEVII